MNHDDFESADATYRLIRRVGGDCVAIRTAQLVNEDREEERQHQREVDAHEARIAAQIAYEDLVASLSKRQEGRK